MLLNGIRGFCMALADSVPGVSGGTIAFLLGFYDQFIESLNHLIGSDGQKRMDALKFLFKLGIGWVIGMGLSVTALTGLFETQIYEISSLFIGLTLFAIPLVIKEEWESINKKWKNIVFFLFGMALVYSISRFSPGGDGGVQVSAEHLSLPLALYVFFASMIAITAMVLPGISGSTLLLIFGLYVPIIQAVHEVMSFNLSYAPILMVFGLGVASGIIGIIRIIRLCLREYRSQTIYGILGLMAGSLYAITMGPETLDVPQPPLSLSSFNPFFFALGGAILAGLEFLKIRLNG